jgi:Zn-dependent membrane protease YugP
MVPGLLLSLWASFKVKRCFAKYNNVQTQGGLTAAQVARRILDVNGLNNVAVQVVAGRLSDNYNPRTKTVNLSSATYASASVGAVGVAAHEVGHAVQHALGYAPARIRTAIVPICNVSTGLAVPLLFAGFLLQMFGLVYIGIGLFSLAVLFQMVTLPVEFNASKRAITTLNNLGFMNAEELTGVKKVLTAAALTYVAALLSSILQLLYYITLASGRRRN